MDAVKDKLYELIQAVKDSPEYQNFEKYKYELNKNYDLRRRVDDYRRICYSMQQSGEDLYDKSDDLTREFSDLFANTTSQEFLMAESSVCRMIREICIALSREIDVDITL